MEANDPVHQFRRRVLILAELHAPAEQCALCRKTVQPDVRAVYNRLDETLIRRLVDLAPECRDKGIPHPVKHAAIVDEIVLYIRI